MLVNTSKGETIWSNISNIADVSLSDFVYGAYRDVTTADVKLNAKKIEFQRIGWTEADTLQEKNKQNPHYYWDVKIEINIPEV